MFVKIAIASIISTVAAADCSFTVNNYPGAKSDLPLWTYYQGTVDQYKSITPGFEYFFKFNETASECAMDRCALYTNDTCKMGIWNDDYPDVSVVKYKDANQMWNFEIKQSQNMMAGEDYKQMAFCCNTTGNVQMVAPLYLKQYPQCPVEKSPVS